MIRYTYISVVCYKCWAIRSIYHSVLFKNYFSSKKVLMWYAFFFKSLFSFLLVIIFCHRSHIKKVSYSNCILIQYHTQLYNTTEKICSLISNGIFFWVVVNIFFMHIRLSLLRRWRDLQKLLSIIENWNYWKDWNNLYGKKNYSYSFCKINKF